jgi:hypothetical protein
MDISRLRIRPLFMFWDIFMFWDMSDTILSTQACTRWWREVLQSQGKQASAVHEPWFAAILSGLKFIYLFI